MNARPLRNETPNLPALVADAGDEARGDATTARRRRSAGSASASDAAFIAAQAHAARGLKGGGHVLVDARSTYLNVQWSGEHDRRPEAGLLVRTCL